VSKDVNEEKIQIRDHIANSSAHGSHTIRRLPSSSSEGSISNNIKHIIIIVVIIIIIIIIIILQVVPER